MSKKIMRLLVLVVLMGLGGIAGRVNERYVSGWTLVEGGTQETFVHGLGGRPLEVQVWAALPVSAANSAVVCQADFQAVVPAESEGVRVRLVGAEGVMVENVGDVPVCVQVVGRR